MESFANRLLHLHSLKESHEMELLQEEFVSYQLLSDTDIPSEVWAEAKVGEDQEAYQIDILGGICVRF